MEQSTPGETHVESWECFSKLVESHADGKWIFRGVSCASYRLIPKIGRDCTRQNPTTGDDLKYCAKHEEKMFNEFKRLARPYFTHRPEGALETLAVGQHHGLPTRLLDWTESPLVAAYFATEASNKHSDPPAIYAVRGLPEVKGDCNPFNKIDETSFYRPPHISPRIPAQRAFFTVHQHPNKPFEHRELEKWTLLKKGRQTFWLKNILDACAVNRAALFPDLDGLSVYLGWRYKWGKL